MFWLGVLLVSPLWGVISTTLFLQILLALANVAINLFGFARGRVSRATTGMAVAIAAVAAVVFSLLLQGGHWLLADSLRFGGSLAESIVYWVFAAITTVGILLETPGKLMKTWRQATLLGTLEADMAGRTE